MNIETFTYIDRTNPQKLYVQLYEILKDKIESGAWKVNDQIPTEKELCDTFNVSKATVRLALSELEKQGYVKKLQGRGTFVSKKEIPEGISMLTSFKEDLFEESVMLQTKILAQTVIMPINQIDKKLSISADKHVIYIKRLRSWNSEPVLIQDTYIPYHICPSLLTGNLLHLSLSNLIESFCKRRISKVEDYISIEFIKKADSEFLEVAEGTAGLLIEQFFYDGPQRIAYSRSLKRPDKLKFFIELKMSL